MADDTTKIGQTGNSELSFYHQELLGQLLSGGNVDREYLRCALVKLMLQGKLTQDEAEKIIDRMIDLTISQKSAQIAERSAEVAEKNSRTVQKAYVVAMISAGTALAMVILKIVEMIVK